MVLNVLEGVCLLYGAVWHKNRTGDGSGNLCLALLASLGGNQHYAVGTLNTEHCRGGSILQDGNALDFLGVDVVHETGVYRHTVHLYQWRIVAPSSLTTYVESGLVVARLTRVLH